MLKTNVTLARFPGKELEKSCIDGAAFLFTQLLASGNNFDNDLWNKILQPLFGERLADSFITMDTVLHLPFCKNEDEWIDGALQLIVPKYPELTRITALQKLPRYHTKVNDMGKPFLEVWKIVQNTSESDVIRAEALQSMARIANYCGYEAQLLEFCGKVQLPHGDKLLAAIKDVRCTTQEM